MPSRELPVRPNLEQLKKQAKSLLHEAQARDPEALRRFAVVPAFSGKPVDGIASPISRCTTRSRLSRVSTASHPGTRCGKKWRRGRSRSKRQSMSSSAARQAARPGRAERLLALYPRIASATLHTALVLGDAARSTRSYATTGAGHSGGRPAELGAAALRVPHVMHQGQCRAPRRARRPSRGNCAHSARIPTPSITGTGIRSCREPSSGPQSARSGTYRSPTCCSRPARTRPMASPRTSPVAAATSMRSSCCVDLVWTSTGFPAACRRSCT